MFRTPLSLLILFGLIGCRTPSAPALPEFPEKKWPEGTTPPSSLPAGLRYRIISVSTAGDFVVLEDPLRLTEGHGGSVFRNNKAVGRVRLTGSRNGSAIAADITAGSAEKGDLWEPDPH